MTFFTPPHVTFYSCFKAFKCKINCKKCLLKPNSLKLKKGLKPRLKPSVDFTNILRAAFTLIDAKSVKKTDNLTEIFYIFGICPRSMLMKLIPSYFLWGLFWPILRQVGNFEQLLKIGLSPKLKWCAKVRRFQLCFLLFEISIFSLLICFF